MTGWLGLRSGTIEFWVWVWVPDPTSDPAAGAPAANWFAELLK